MRKQSIAAALGLVSLVSFPVFADLSMTMVGRYQSGIYGEGAAEIIDYHKKTQQAYVVNGAKNRVDISTPSYNQVTSPLYLRSIDRWKNYEKHFKDSKEYLDKWVNQFDYKI